MKNFIEVTDSNGNRHLINILHIEEIAEKNEDSCWVYLDVVTNGQAQNFYSINETYDAIKKLIEVREVRGDENHGICSRKHCMVQLSL